MQQWRSQLTAVSLNAALIAAGAWFVFEAGRWLWTKIREYRLNGELKTGSVPMKAGEVWPYRQLVFTDRERTVILAVSADCQACLESRPFYRQLISVSKTPAGYFGVSLLLNELEDNKHFVESLGQGHMRTREASLRALGISRTPIVWVVDKGGRVLSVHVGRLSKTEEGNIAGLATGRLRSLGAGTAQRAELPFELTSRHLLTLFKTTSLQVLDVRSREAFGSQTAGLQAVNIPVDELAFRAEEELDPSRPTVVDCTHIEPSICDTAAFTLGRVGFFRVHVLNRRSTPMTDCQTRGASNGR